jgi:uncharacterized protein involved in outer membrane biogenesis
MRALRIALGSLCILLVAAVAAAWVVPPVADMSRYRAAIAAETGRLLGQPVAISGPMRITLLPQPELVADDVTIGAGAMTVPQLRIQAALVPLLSGHVVPQRVVLQAPTLHLPWPLPPLRLAPLPHPLSVSVQGGNLTIGTADFDAVDATGGMAPDGALSMTVRAKSRARGFVVNANVAAPGKDGSSALDVHAAGLDGAWGNAAIGFAGQLAPDGSAATGRLHAQGADLSVVGFAPSLSFHLDGSVSWAYGRLAADSLDCDIGGQAATAAVALRLLPLPHLPPRLDLALNATRLDLSAWLPKLAASNTLPLPASLDLAADAASMAGTEVARLRVALDVAPAAVTVREASAELPQGASLSLSGSLTDGDAFVGRATLRAPDFRGTVSWASRRWLGVDLGGAMPGSASVSARVSWLSGALSLEWLDGTADNGAVAGSVRLDTEGGPPRVAADLSLERLSLALPRIATLPTALPLAADVRLSVAHASLGGVPLELLTAQLAGDPAGVEVRRVAFLWQGARVEAQGRLRAGGQVDDARLAAQGADAASLVGLRPAIAPFAQGHFALDLHAHGKWPALEGTGSVTVGDLAAGFEGKGDVAARTASGTATLHHPAVALAAGPAEGGALAWLGEGPLDARAHVVLSAGQVALNDLAVGAGALKAAGRVAVTLSAPMRLTGQMAAETLPLPPVAWHGTTPIPLDWLRGWEAVLDITADRLVQGDATIVRQFAARLGLADGVVGVGGISGQAAGGALSGGAVLDAAATPPKLSLDLSLADVGVAGPLTGLPFDLLAGRAGVQVRLSAEGYSPSAMLATLSGHATASAHDGALRGFSLPLLRGALRAAEAGRPERSQAPLLAALRDGRTPFTVLRLSADLDGGVATFADSVIEAPEGSAKISGTLAVPTGTLDVLVRLHPAFDGSPDLGLHLSGPFNAPERVPEIAPALRWLSRS